MYVQTFCINYTLEKPRAELGDAQLSPLLHRVSAVCPVLHLFGKVHIPVTSTTTDAATTTTATATTTTTWVQRSVCLHVHGVYPYFLVPQYDAAVTATQFGAQLERAALHALERARGQLHHVTATVGDHDDEDDEDEDAQQQQHDDDDTGGGSGGRHGRADAAARPPAFAASASTRYAPAQRRTPMQLLHDVEVVQRVPFYGYHASARGYYKISVIHPARMQWLMSLLHDTTAVGGRRWQLLEGHNKYHAQFMVDYDVSGIAPLRLARGCHVRSPCVAEVLQLYNSNNLLQQQQQECVIDVVHTPEDVLRVTPCDVELDVAAHALREPHRAPEAGRNLAHLRRVLRCYFAAHGVADELRVAATMAVETTWLEQWKGGGGDGGDGNNNNNNNNKAAAAAAPPPLSRYGDVVQLQSNDPDVLARRQEMLRYLEERLAHNDDDEDEEKVKVDEDNNNNKDKDKACVKGVQKQEHAVAVKRQRSESSAAAAANTQANSEDVQQQQQQQNSPDGVSPLTCELLDELAASLPLSQHGDAMMPSCRAHSESCEANDNNNVSSSTDSIVYVHTAAAATSSPQQHNNSDTHEHAVLTLSTPPPLLLSPLASLPSPPPSTAAPDRDADVMYNDDDDDSDTALLPSSSALTATQTTEATTTATATTTASATPQHSQATRAHDDDDSSRVDDHRHSSDVSSSPAPLLSSSSSLPSSADAATPALFTTTTATNATTTTTPPSATRGSHSNKRNKYDSNTDDDDDARDVVGSAHAIVVSSSASRPPRRVSGSVVHVVDTSTPLTGTTRTTPLRQPQPLCSPTSSDAGDVYAALQPHASQHTPTTVLLSASPQPLQQQQCDVSNNNDHNSNSRQRRSCSDVSVYCVPSQHVRLLQQLSTQHVMYVRSHVACGGCSGSTMQNDVHTHVAHCGSSQHEEQQQRRHVACMPHRFVLRYAACAGDGGGNNNNSSSSSRTAAVVHVSAAVPLSFAAAARSNARSAAAAATAAIAADTPVKQQSSVPLLTCIDAVATAASTSLPSPGAATTAAAMRDEAAHNSNDNGKETTRVVSHERAGGAFFTILPSAASGSSARADDAATTNAEQQQQQQQQQQPRTAMDEAAAAAVTQSLRLQCVLRVLCVEVLLRRRAGVQMLAADTMLAVALGCTTSASDAMRVLVLCVQDNNNNNNACGVRQYALSADVDVVELDSEVALMQRVVREVRAHDADVVLSWEGYKYGIGLLALRYARVLRRNLASDLSRLARDEDVALAVEAAADEARSRRCGNNNNNNTWQQRQQQLVTTTASAAQPAHTTSSAAAVLVHGNQLQRALRYRGLPPLSRPSLSRRTRPSAAAAARRRARAMREAAATPAAVAAAQLQQHQQQHALSRAPRPLLVVAAAAAAAPPPPLADVAHANLHNDNSNNNTTSTDVAVTAARQYAQRFGANVRVAGRVCLSLGKCLRKEVKMPSYTLSMAYQTLLQRPLPYFDDVCLATMYDGGDGARDSACGATAAGPPPAAAAAAAVAMRHAALHHLVTRVVAAHRVARHLHHYARTMEYSRMFGILYEEVSTRGSQFRVEATLRRMAGPRGYAMLSPTRAMVLAQPRIRCVPLIMQPVCDYYTDPVLVLDFRSLYPSVIAAYNLCYTTCVGLVQPHTRSRLGVLREYAQDNRLLAELLGLRRPTAAAAPAAAAAVAKVECTSPHDDVKRRRARSSSDNNDNSNDDDDGDDEAAARSSSDSSGSNGGGGEDVIVTPNGAMFLRPTRRVGVLPDMIRTVLDTRFELQAALRHVATPLRDAAMRQRLTEQQQALKMLANVTYGYTGASHTGRMPCVDLADAIVALGRQTLERAIALVEATPAWRARVVYGDTDSLFVHLPGRTRAEAFVLGEQMAAAVTAANPAPVRLQFEKVLQPCFLVVKKRYAGYAWYKPAQTTPQYLGKGIETERRDQCPATAKLTRVLLDGHFGGATAAQLRRRYYREVGKLQRGDCNPADGIFRRAVKLGRYKDESHLPLGAHLALRLMERDLAQTPFWGERVPYVVLRSLARDALRQCVAHPLQLLYTNHGDVALDAGYYIHRHINPALDRIFYLVNVSFARWFAEMPRRREADVTTAYGGGSGSATMARVSSDAVHTRAAADAGGGGVDALLRLQTRARRWWRYGLSADVDNNGSDSRSALPYSARPRLRIDRSSSTAGDDEERAIVIDEEHSDAGDGDVVNDVDAPSLPQQPSPQERQQHEQDDKEAADTADVSRRARHTLDAYYPRVVCVCCEQHTVTLEEQQQTLRSLLAYYAQQQHDEGAGGNTTATMTAAGNSSSSSMTAYNVRALAAVPPICAACWRDPLMLYSRIAQRYACVARRLRAVEQTCLHCIGSGAAAPGGTWAPRAVAAHAATNAVADIEDCDVTSHCGVHVAVPRVLTTAVADATLLAQQQQQQSSSSSAHAASCVHENTLGCTSIDCALAFEKRRLTLLLRKLRALQWFLQDVL